MHCIVNIFQPFSGFHLFSVWKICFDGFLDFLYAICDGGFSKWKEKNVLSAIIILSQESSKKFQ